MARLAGTDYRGNIEQRLISILNRPLMYASCNEAYLAQVCTLIECLRENDYTLDLFGEFIARSGAAFLSNSKNGNGLLDPVEPEWCDRVKKRIVELLPELFNN